ncbi:hypothetical protein PR202_gb09475 [Eleusine coracana subsp. coracana]|uniref:Uncharacterized protein n=1 Tax=Eleusine coracana subsp. coracana TaxID=191504 RepID=A0AAV5EHI0_ELECO|nr:hypothetical protein PR202_gb09475 [Eleusine coracana subsp. coracana]
MEEDGNMNWKHEQEFGFLHKDLNIRNFIPSPCGPLTFPVVSMEEPHVGYFVIGEPGCGIRKVWLLSVDLISLIYDAIHSYTKHLKDSKIENMLTRPSPLTTGTFRLTRRPRTSSLWYVLMRLEVTTVMPRYICRRMHIISCWIQEKNMEMTGFCCF